MSSQTLALTLCPVWPWRAKETAHCLVLTALSTGRIPPTERLRKTGRLPGFLGGEITKGGVAKHRKVDGLGGSDQDVKQFAQII